MITTQDILVAVNAELVEEQIVKVEQVAKWQQK